MNRKSKLSHRIFSLVLSLALLVTCFTVVMTSVSAQDEIEVVGAMSTIKEKFDANYLAQDTVRADDKFVGKIQYTAYYDTSKGAIKTGYEGTPIIVYTINHPSIERIGTDSDTDIIQSMLDRGYVVIVLDYLNNVNAVSPAIDNSSQQFRADLKDGRIIKQSTVFPSNAGYQENFLAPAGYNVLINQVFWEIDKHSAEGTLEKIVENWNSDFRATKGGKLLKWATGDTLDTRKAVQNDLSGNAPVWYNASGKADENGLYTYVKFTKAETVTDCVDPDGSFLDMNLYINIVYPTKPAKEVPVMSLANSSGYPTTSTTSADIRPHSNGFLYNGYANVVFDYLWQPMARNASWGYYDGSQGNTADHMNYGLMMYNDKLVNTAAMRYLRYISLSGGNEYNFDLDAFGVYGNSKGGWFSFLGEEVLQSNLVDPTGKTLDELENAIDKVLSEFVPDRYYKGHHGETRYQVGAGEINKDGFTVKAGEKQPWLTYNGVEILSGAQLTNACNGSQEEDITAGHSPIFISGNMADTYNAAYGYSANIYNMCRELNIPLLHFEVPIGHTLTSGIDMNYNVDTYEAYFRYVNYYLKKTPISVAYISPMDNAGNVGVTDKITIYFAGAVTSTEIEKVSVSSSEGAVNGKWESAFGGTTWTFTPDSLSGSTLYTVTVPSDLKGDNGVAMGTAYTASFITELDNATATNINGSYHTVTVPAFTTGNSFVFRFLVDNDAVNVAELYAVNAEGETTGEYLGSAKVNGFGTYEIDITDFAAANTGKDVVLYLKTAKTAGNYNLFTTNGAEYDPFDTYKPTKNNVTFTYGAVIDGETTIKAAITSPVNKNNISYYYDNVTNIFTYSNIVGSTAVANNEGKRFVISFDVYDTTSRRVQVKLNTMTNRVDYGTIDYDHIIFTVETKANEWTHVEFTYNPYETKYGTVSNGKTQSLAFYLSPDGDTAAPAYFNNLKSVEVLTEIDVLSAVIAEKDDGTGIAYTPEISETPFAVYNGDAKIGDYAGWKAALAAYKSGYTIKLQADYTFTDADITNVIGNFATVNVDLGSYTITSENTKNSLLYASATNTAKTTVNVSGGAILLNKTPLISYENSSAAGSGKTFNFNINDTYIGFVENAFATEILSTRSTSSGIVLNSNIALNDCVIDLPDANHARDAFVVFTNPTASTLKVKYNLTGGEIRLTSQRWATISENANIVEFFTDANGNYTTLVMPAANTYEVTGSYLNAEGYAVYTKASEANNMVTYTLETGENSTRYGVITDNYLDATKYPFLVFKDGNLLGGYGDYKAAVDAAANLLNGITYAESEAQILMRSHQSTDKEVTLGASAGTIVVDLNGFTLTRVKNPASMTVNSNTAFDYATGILYKNGRIEMNHSYNSSKDTYSAGLLGATHVLAETTKVKTFNVTYENITFGFADGYYSALNANGLLWAVWQNSYTSETVTNLTLNDCVFDFTKNAPAGKNLITANGLYADFNIEINGGEIKGDASAYTLVITDAEDNFVLGKNSNGEYIKLAEGAKPSKDNFPCDDGAYRYFEKTESGYEFTINHLSTAYGSISPEYSDEEKYPFALFANGSFMGAYTHWANTDDTDATDDNKDVVQYAKNQVSGAGGKGKITTIYLRRNYALDSTEYSLNNNGVWAAESYNNYSQVGGTVVVDLGGHTLTLGAKVFMPSTAKLTSNVAHDSKFKFINGTINLNNQPLIEYGSSEALTSSKNFDYTFEDIKFILSADQGASLVKSGSFAGTATVNANVEFTNCTFDYSKVSSSAFTLFNISHSELAANVTVNGGSIISNIDALSKITVASLGTNGKVTFGKLDGKYITLATPTTEAYKNVHYTGSFNTDEGKMYFIEMSDDGVTSTYELGKMDYDGYGTIKMSESKFFSAVDFPFVTFMDGAFKAGYGTWKEAINAAKGLVSAAGTENKTAVILQRRDYTLTKAKDSGSNFNSARGKIVLDLNGFTMTNTDNYFIDIYFNYTNATDIAYLGYKSSIEIKNGTLLNTRSGLPMIAIGHVNKNDSYPIKEFGFTFTNVKFGFASGIKHMIQEWNPDTTNNKHNGDGLKIDYVFDGCTFDFTSAASGASILIATNKYNQPSLVIKGGKIIADNFANYTLYSIKSEAVNYLEKDEDGKYITLTQLTTATAPTVTYKNVNGSVLSFVKDSVDGLYTTYATGEPIETPYGEIPVAYQSAELYPFVAFDEKGNFIVAAPYFYGANKSDSIIGKTKDYMAANVWDGTGYGNAPKAAYIIMRRDYTMANDETFNNLAQVQGILTIDLNGYTFTMNDSRVMFPASIKPWGGSGDAKVFKSQFDLINGTINLSAKALIDFNAWAASGTDVSGKQFIYNFTDIKFVASAKTTSMFTNYSANNETPTAIGNPELIFNNCTFDLTKAQGGVVIFNLGNGYIHTTITVNGGEIIANNTSFVMSAKNENTTSSLILDKSADEKYITVTLPAGTDAPAGTYVIKDGIECVFGKVSENDKNVTYGLYPGAFVGYKIKTSVTLWSNFVYNIYIPKDNFNKATVNGSEATCNEVVVDGVAYYHIAVNLPAGETLSDIKLCVTVNHGDTTANANWTLNISNYAKAIMNGEFDDVTKTLMKDMLVYAVAAHNYFDNTEEVAEKLAQIETLLEGYEKAMPTGEAKKPSDKTYFTDVKVYVGDVPSFRFTLAEGYTADDFTFNVGEKAANVIKGDGYVEIVMYAFRMLEDVTFTVKATGVSESYNLYAYYEYAKTLNDAKLVAIVEGLMKYSVSAADYRNTVIGSNK